jgi:hypothetical protein
MDKKPGGVGFSPFRLSKVPLREMMKRVLPDTSVSKEENNYKVQVNSMSASSKKVKTKVKKDYYKLSERPVKLVSTVKPKTAVVQGHAIAIRDNNPDKEFGSSDNGHKYYSWSAREQDLFNGESRFLFSANEKTVRKWVKLIDARLDL